MLWLAELHNLLQGLTADIGFTALSFSKLQLECRLLTDVHMTDVAESYHSPMWPQGGFSALQWCLRTASSRLRMPHVRMIVCAADAAPCISVHAEGHTPSISGLRQHYACRYMPRARLFIGELTPVKTMLARWQCKVGGISHSLATPL